MAYYASCLWQPFLWCTHTYYWTQDTYSYWPPTGNEKIQHQQKIQVTHKNHTFVCLVTRKWTAGGKVNDECELTLGVDGFRISLLHVTTEVHVTFENIKLMKRLRATYYFVLQDGHLYLCEVLRHTSQVMLDAFLFFSPIFTHEYDSPRVLRTIICIKEAGF